MNHVRRLALVLAVALLGSRASGDPTAAAPKLADLEFLAGVWVSDAGATRVEESWLCPAFDTMIGMGRTTSAATGKTLSFEYLRIESRNEGLVYVAQPKGGRATEFRLVLLSGGTATFENLAHDFPKRIVYSTNARGGLTARVEGDPSAGEKPEEIRYRRAAGGCR
jgi:hypothetical protein